jgi:DNA-binding HxlR family transcriptional regulator
MGETVNLSPTQHRVVRLMAEGWELLSDSYINHTWLQREGRMQTVSSATLRALVDRLCITRQTYAYPIQTYRLTPRGEAAREHPDG